MGVRAVRRKPYGVVQAILAWAWTNWVFIDGYYIGKGVDIELLDANRFVNLISNHYVEDLAAASENPPEAREILRGRLIKMYNGEYNNYGSANDNSPFGIQDGGQHPSAPEIEPDDEGYPGLEAPLG